MSKRLKNVILFAIFILILFLFTFTSVFQKGILWPQLNHEREFTGIIFQNPANVTDLVISRSIVKENSEDLIKLDVTFTYDGNDSVARILGTPARNVFFAEKVNPTYSVVTLKGDFDKVNNTLFNEKLKLRDLYKKSPGDPEFVAKSVLKLPLTSKVNKYQFTVFYDPQPLMYSDGRKVEDATVFLTNARVEDWQESTKGTNSAKEAFSKSGYYVNQLELINESLVTKISFVNTLSTVLFLLSCIMMGILIWMNHKKFIFFLIPMLIMIPSSYRFLEYGVSTLGLLIAFPILAFIAALIAHIMARPTIKMEKKEIKQSVAFAIVFFLFSLVLFIIPRAF